jgi:hypothetical protein
MEYVSNADISTHLRQSSAFVSLLLTMKASYPGLLSRLSPEASLFKVNA